MLDYLIIGAGPAGVQTAYHLKQNDLSYLMLESGQRAGCFFETFPIHRKLISINKVYTGSTNPEFNLRHDWNSILTDDYSLNFSSFDQNFFPSADNLVKYLNHYVDQNQLNVAYNQHVKSIEKIAGHFVVTTTSNDQYEASRVIVSTGVPKPYIPKIEGIELVTQYSDLNIDLAPFANKRVLILGKGNSAFETADHLIPATSLIHVCSPNPLDMAWKTHYVGDLRAVNNNILDTYQLKSQNAILDADIKLIEKRDDRFIVHFSYAHANGEQETIEYDEIICCTGFAMDSSVFADSAKPDLMIEGRFPSLDCSFESINVKGLYFAGTLTQSTKYRKSTSGFIHGFRYNSRALVEMLKQKHHDTALACDQHLGTPEAISSAILSRINETSALWQQHGFMVDAVTVSETGMAQYYKHLPSPYLHAHLGDHYHLQIALDFGAPIEGDPFNQVRVHKDNATDAELSKFLHPIIELCHQGEVIETHHIIEDLEADWTDIEAHVKPLQQFIERVLPQLAGEKMQNKASA